MGIRFEDIDVAPIRFHTSAEFRDRLEHACRARPDVARFHDLGLSEEGRPVYGCEIGMGPLAVSLIAGAHADEPVGPETLRRLVVGLLGAGAAHDDLLRRFRFLIVPHINPDGEARNQPWIRAWPDVRTYIRDVVRELPGRDLEFGFPAMRVENRLVADWLRPYAPFAMHASLHGMGFSEGAMLLIERAWVDRTRALREGFAGAAHEAGWPLHDHDRAGEKGFAYIEPGFTTTPRGAAMREHFQERGEPEVAAQFHDSSMEMVRAWGGDALCLVTELPLFLVEQQTAGSEGGRPEAYLAFRELLPELKLRLRAGGSVEDVLGRFGIEALDLGAAMRVQLRALGLGLEAIDERPEVIPG